MNRKINYFWGSLALLFFFFLLGWVLLAPVSLTALDSSLQQFIRGDLPAFATFFFSRITLVFNPSIVVIWVLLVAVFFFVNKKKRSALFLLGNLVLSGLLIVILKHLIRRPRPLLVHLVKESGFSFPSGHALAATLICGSLMILAGLSVRRNIYKRLLQVGLGFFVGVILLSRIYLGVHYPSDVLAGCLLGIACLQLESPRLKKWLKKDYLNE